MRCTARLENRARRDGYRLIAGADEVGRGALFGPVMAAAVILDPDRPIRGLNDSKQLDPETRLEMAPLIREQAIAWAVAALDSARIDWINIYQASREAMRRAVAALTPQPDLLFVDALTLDVPTPQRSLIHGDAQSVSIAAASILAKVERDAIMQEWDAVYPEYGLASNKGYATPDHRSGLQGHGITPLHRLSYAPVGGISLFPVSLFEEEESPQLLLPLGEPDPSAARD
jgi:ribonuclease HII